MNKFYGEVGYVSTVETSPGVHEMKAEEYCYIGDILRNNKHWDNTDHLNDDIRLGHTISIVDDERAYADYYKIRYVKIHGQAWRVTNVEVKRPRILLYIGGLYNGETLKTETT